MRFPSDVCLRSLRGLGLAIVVVLGSLSGIGWAQEPVGEAGISQPLPDIRIPTGESPPAIGWSLRSIMPESGTPAWMQDASPVVFSLPSRAGGVSFQFRNPETTALGPIVDLGKPLPEAGKAIVKANEPEPESGPLQVGNGSFKRMAQSFNLDKPDDPRRDDLSRQLGKVGGTPNIATSIPLTGWAIAAVAVLVVLVAMSVAYYENDEDDRKRRKKVRRRKHRQSS